MGFRAFDGIVVARQSRHSKPFCRLQPLEADPFSIRVPPWCPHGTRRGDDFDGPADSDPPVSTTCTYAVSTASTCIGACHGVLIRQSVQPAGEPSGCGSDRQRSNPVPQFADNLRRGLAWAMAADWPAQTCMRCASPAFSAAARSGAVSARRTG
jgi:hypothetical protein